MSFQVGIGSLGGIVFSGETLHPSANYGRRRHYALSSYLFPFLKVSSQTFVVQTIVFQAKTPSQCVFKFIQYDYEIFQTVLTVLTVLNCKIK